MDAPTTFQDRIEGTTQTLLPSSNDEDAKRITTQGDDDIRGLSRYLRDLFKPTCCRYGILWLAAVVLFQAGQVVLISKVSHILGAVQALSVRSVFFLSAVAFISWPKSPSYGLTEAGLYLMAGLADSLYVLLVGLAGTYIWVGDVSAICLNLPVPSTLLAYVLFGEAVDAVDVSLALLNACGLLFVSRPSFLFPQQAMLPEISPSQTAYGVLLALGSLAVSVVATLSTRALVYRHAEDACLLSTMTGLIGLSLSTSIMFVDASWVLPRDFDEWLVIIALGTCSLFAFCAYVKSLETEPVLTVTVVITLSIPLNNIYDLIFLSRQLEWLKVGGVALILGSTFVMFIKKLCISRWSQ